MKRLLPVLLVCGTALFSQQSSSLDRADSGKLNIRLVNEIPSMHVAGKRDPAVWRVQVTDASGAPVRKALVCFRLPSNGAGGRFPGGISTSIVETDEHGIAEAGRVTWNSEPGIARAEVIAAKGDLRVEERFAIPILAGSSQQSSQIRSRRKIWAVASFTAAGVAAGLGWGKR